MSLGRTKIASVLSASALVIGATAAAAALPDLPGAYETPTLASQFNRWGNDGMLAANGTGAFMGDGTVRAAAAPSKAIALATADPMEVVNAFYDRGGANTVNDRFLWTASYSWETEHIGSLYAVDLGTGQVFKGKGDDVAQLFGATNNGWIVQLDNGNYVRRAFSNGANLTFTLPADGQRILAAGTAGVLFLNQDQSGNSELRLLTGADLKTNSGTFNLAQRLVSNDMGGPDIQVAMDRGAVAYVINKTGEIGYFRNGAGSSSKLTATDECFVQLTVIPGAMILNNCWGEVTEMAFATNGVVDLSGSQEKGYPQQFMPWSTPTGAPAFTSLVWKPGVSQLWSRWLPGSADSTVVQPTPTSKASIAGVTGSNGRLLSAYDLKSDGTATVYVRALGATSSTVKLTVDRASAARGRAYGLSGVWSALPEWNDGYKGQTLRIRREATVTGTVDIGYGVHQVQQSGPFTAYIDTTGAGVGAGFVVSSTAAVVAALPTNVSDLAIDGTQVAYMLKDKSVWYRDLNKVVGAGNPVKVLPACAMCDRLPVLLSAKWVVVDDIGTGLTVFNVVTKTKTTIALGNAVTCHSMNGAVVFCYDGESGDLSTVDLTASKPVAAPVVTTMDFNAWTLAGHRAVWGSSLDPRTRDVIASKIANLPVAVDKVGAPRLLGPWSATGSTLSLSGAAWAPQMAVSDTLNTWTVTLKNAAGGNIKVWSGTAPDGEIKGVSWDGKLKSGAAAAVGTYTWTLTGSGPYGAPVAVTGSGAATGTITVTK